MVYVEGNLHFYYYGENKAPAGAGKGAQIFGDIVAAARSSGQKFEDPNFPADSTSLVGLSLRHHDEKKYGVKWHRPTEIAQDMYQSDPIFHGPYSEFDIIQGGLGDCWWLAVLADASVKPECINTLVPTDNVDAGWDTGAFHFRFWCRGDWVDVVIDDRLPCRVDEDGTIKNTVCAHPTEKGGFWVPLLEKAYAKLYGKYHDISGGWGTDAMLDFTGGFPLDYTPGEDKNLKAVLLNSQKLDAIVSFGTCSADDLPADLLTPPNPKSHKPEAKTKVGIVLGHEYSMLDIQEVQDKNDSSKKYTLLKLRNPWGNKRVWTGNFSYNDPNNMWDTVTPDLRDTTGKRKDGEFWIEYEDFKTYFNEIDVCLWSGKYRGYKTEKTPGGADLFIKHGHFAKENSGEVNSKDDVKHKRGYYAHLKPTDSKYNLSGVTSQLDGLDRTCAIHITMVYSNYTNTDGRNPDIEQYGFFVFWAPGHTDPKDSDKIYNHEFYDKLTSKNRSTIYHKYLPEGTVLIIPWITNPPPTDTSTPYFLRIAIDGDVHHYHPE